MKPRLILWDWNGTLLDDAVLSMQCLNRNLSAHGYPQQFDLDGYREVFGFPIEDYYRLAGFDFTRHPYPLLAQYYMDDYIPASRFCPLVPGAVSVLSELRRRGYRQVILSVSPIDTLTAQVGERGVRSFFDELLGLTDIYGKSKAELARGYFAHCGYTPEEVVMVGDSTHDFEVAQALGVRPILCSAGHQSAERLRGTGAEVVASLRELLSLLEN